MKRDISIKRLFSAITCTIVVTLITFGSNNAWSHDDYYDRFVHAGGVDEGDCKDASAPCATIDYALKHAQKGETVRVAQGTYRFERDDPAEAITLLGPMVKVIGGYSPTDDFAKQDVTANPTNIVGPAHEYAERFAERGFNLVTPVAEQAIGAADVTPSHFVTENGSDEGLCTTLNEPCLTLGYAIGNASSGDVVAIAEGTFLLDSDDLTDANTRGVRLQGGYTSAFEVVDPDSFHTYVTGPSHDNRESLASMGLKLIQDAKGEAIKEAALTLDESALTDAAQTTAATQCVDGFAGSFPCNGIELLSRIPLSGFSSQPSSATDIWGFVDLNDQREYALIGFNNGVAVVDVSDPQNPREVGTVSGPDAGWRDIKVYQFFDSTLERYRAYAYATADFPSSPQGLQVIDLSELPSSVSLAGSYDGINRAHNVYMANINYATGEAVSGSDAYIYILGADTDRGAVQILDVENPASPRRVTGGVSGASYTHDATNVLITDSRVSQCPSGRNPCELFVGYDEDSISIWDVSDKSNPVRLSNTAYQGARYTHSGWWSEDKRFLFIQDELDESAGANTTLYTMDISDLRNPTIQRSWTGPTQAIDHNGFTLGDRYYMSNYRRGLTVLDVSDPNSPRDDAFFDTFPSPAANTANFNGAWGVYPFLPSGTLLVSDINNGLFLLNEEEGETNAPAITTPAAGATLSPNSATITWADNGTAVTDWWLYAGNAQSGTGQYLYDRGGSLPAATRSADVTGLPGDSSTVYVTLWYKTVNSGWESVITDYTAASSGGGVPEISSPVAGATLSSSTETFTFAANDVPVDEYWLYVGSGVNQYDYYNSGTIADTSTQVTSLPTNGETVYVRLWHRVAGGGWKSVDTTYTAASVPTPAMSSPANGSTISTTQAFNWTANGTNVGEWWLYAGTAPGRSDLYDSGTLGSATSETISGLSSGSVYVTLWYRATGGTWQSVRYLYTVQ